MRISIVLLTFAAVAFLTLPSLIMSANSITTMTTSSTTCTVQKTGMTDRYGSTFEVYPYSKDQSSKATFFYYGYWTVPWQAILEVFNHNGKLVYESQWKYPTLNGVSFSYTVVPRQTTSFKSIVTIYVPSPYFEYSDTLYFVVSC